MAPILYSVPGRRQSLVRHRKLSLGGIFLVVLTGTAFLKSSANGIPCFLDVAQQAGLTDSFYCGGEKEKKYIIETMGGGVALFDYNNDGYVDAFFVTGSTLEGFLPGQEPVNQLYRNNGNGTFTRVTREAGLEQSGWGQGVCVGDYDKDGFDDLFVTYYGQNHLYRNVGTGRFRDVTEEAGLKQEERWSTGCAFLDYDRDGRLDLFIANYIVFDKARVPLPGQTPNCRWRGQPVMCGPLGLQGGTNQLFHNEGNGQFRNVSGSSGITLPGERYSFSVTTLDFDLDGWTDIYVAVDSQPSILFHNNCDGTFTDIGVFAGVAYREDGRVQAGMGSAAGDFDGDGNLDLVKTNFIDDTANLYRNSGNGTFEDSIYQVGMTNTRHMGWGVGFFDYDKDGYPDILMVNGHVYPELEAVFPDSPYYQTRLLYRNVEGKRMQDVSEISGPGITAAHSSRGCAFGDYDNDGDVDVFVNNMNQPPSLLRNDLGTRGSFLSIRLVGVKSNRNAIGARVKVIADGKKQVQEVRSGSSFMSHSDFRLHFGLGEAKIVESLEIQWPFNDYVQTITDVQPDLFITITEGHSVYQIAYSMRQK